MSDEASPRPWQWWEGQFLIDANAHSVLEPERMSGRRQVDMKLIVTAVNHHDELVAFLREYLDPLASRPPSYAKASDLLARIAKERGE